MKKFSERMKGFAIGVLITAILSGTVFVAANPGVMREVFYGVNIEVNGTPWNPPADMTPFITEGRTFLPVRGIAEALGVPVDWDGATRTVFVGTRPAGIGTSFWDAVPAFESRGDRAATTTDRMAGNQIFNARIYAAGSSRHNLNGQYRTFRATVGRLDGSAQLNGTLTFTGDGRVLSEIEIGAQDMPRDITVDLTNILHLQIDVVGSYQRNFRWHGVPFVIANAVIE